MAYLMLSKHWDVPVFSFSTNTLLKSIRIIVFLVLPGLVLSLIHKFLILTQSKQCLVYIDKMLIPHCFERLNL